MLRHLWAWGSCLVMVGCLESAVGSTETSDAGTSTSVNDAATKKHSDAASSGSRDARSSDQSAADPGPADAAASSGSQSSNGASAEDTSVADAQEAGVSVADASVADASVVDAGMANQTAPAMVDNDFSIAFDYRFDTANWFDASKRKVLAYAARSWAQYIAEGFVDIPAATPLVLVSPDGNGLVSVRLDSAIDDFLIFPISTSHSVVVTAAAWTCMLSDDVQPPLLRMLDARLSKTGPYQPWTASLGVSRDSAWFVDATPESSDDLLTAKGGDLLSYVVDVIGQALGIAATSGPFSSFVSNGMFRGPKAMEVFGGPVPLAPDLNHYKAGLTYGGQVPAMSYGQPYGRRERVTALDLAVLQDVGYKIRWDRVPR